MRVLQEIREFIRFLEKKGELRRITIPVDCELEITEVCDRIVTRQGPALLFENVVGYDVPVLINLFGSARRMAWALGLDDLDQLGQKLGKLLALAQGPLPGGLLEKLKTLRELAHLAGAAPRVVGSGPCQEVVLTDGFSLERLPILKCWPVDAGRYITLPLVITRDPATGQRNVGCYRLQVFDGQTTGMHWHRHKGGASHYREGELRQQRLEVAVALGADPATIYAGTAPFPPNVDELLVAGILRGEPVELVKCKTVDLEVPAYAEIVLEGYVDPQERRVEGPFGDHTGYYSLADEYPVLHLTAITHRRNPIYPTIVVGRPPQEDYYLGKATERLFLPLIQTVLPEVVDVNMPAEGVFHNLVIVSIRKQHPGLAQKVMFGLWGMGQMMFAKNIVVVDHDVDVQNLSEVAFRATNNVDPRRDVLIVDGPLDALDHASPLPFFGSKMGVDATRKGPLDGHPREWPADIVMSPDIVALVDRKWKSYGIDSP
ncbi:MAG: menaquinone biosynthesis decarboxylase [Chloroflexi bacterium]|nr:menaquinone biosynthesis decarboxylase [Chloroflexota bacterium]